MDRRSFLKRSFTVGLAASGLPGLTGLVRAEEAHWRSFEVTTRIEVLEPVGVVRVWLPTPLLNPTDYFRREADRWSGNYRQARLVQYDRRGTGAVFAEWPAGEESPLLEVKSRFTARDRRVDLDRKPAPLPGENQAMLDHFRKPSRLIRTDGIVASTARSIVGGYERDVDKARAIYEWIVENTFRDPKVKGCGTGDISTMLHTGYFGGKCADLNALYVGLARAAGLPARDVYGIRVANSAEFKCLGRTGDITGAQHCRAEVYLAGFGWTPVDPADVRKVVLEENSPGEPLPLDDPRVRRARQALFGSWEMNWLPYNYAHDLRLPASHGPELGFFMYPQAETAKGRKDCLEPKNFRYTITSREI